MSRVEDTANNELKMSKRAQFVMRGSFKSSLENVRKFYLLDHMQCMFNDLDERMKKIS